MAEDVYKRQALHWDQDFLARKGMSDVATARGLRLVEVLVDGWHRVDIMVGGVGVLDVQVLPDHGADHVRRIHTALLRESHGSGRKLPRLVRRKPGFYPYEGILERAVVVDDNFLRLGGRLVRIHARRDRRHIQSLRRGFSATENDLAGDGGPVVHIRHRGRAAGRCRGGIRLGSFRLLTAAASGQGQRSGQPDSNPNLLHAKKSPWLNMIALLARARSQFP